jgi:membrane protein DedA with SNARE-associated domain
LKFLRAISGTLLAWGPWGILLLAVLDSAGIPVVEGVDFLVVVVSAQDPRTGYLSAALAIAGSVVGSLFLFYLGRKGGEVYLDKKAQSAWAKRFRHWFHHYGGLTVFIPALVPIPLPLKIFVISAGALGMRRRHFLAIMLAARIPRYLGLAYLGSQLGTRPVEYLKHHVWGLVALSAVLFLALLAAVKIKDRIRMRRHHHHLHASHLS